MMSKLKKNKKLIIGLFAVVLCVGLFFFVKEKYIVSTTKKLFHDNNQKEAVPDGTCDKIFDWHWGNNATTKKYEPKGYIVVYVSTADEDDDSKLQVNCHFNKDKAKEYGLQNGVTFKLDSFVNVSGITSGTQYVCKEGAQPLAFTKTDPDANYSLRAKLISDIDIDPDPNSKVDCGATFNIAGGSDESALATEPGDDIDVEVDPDCEGTVCSLPSGEEMEIETSMSDDDFYTGGLDEDEVYEEDGDTLDEYVPDTDEESVKNVQHNAYPYKNSSTRNKDTRNTFTSMQKEMGWTGKTAGDTWEGEAHKRNTLTKYGNHEKFPDNDSTSYEYKTRKNIIFTTTDWSDSGVKQNKGVIDLKCNYDLSMNDLEEIEKRNHTGAKDAETGKLSNYYYDKSNTVYFYGEQKAEIEQEVPLEYKYHINGGLKAAVKISANDSQKVKCTKICQEIVKVEYGPPVYVNAGMCFQYRVKATSIVRCKTLRTSVNPPKRLKKVCLPDPRCSNIRGITRQGGPNEDFEECVNSCDGGMYSKECSDKCYKEVYGNPQEALQQLAIQDIEYRVERLTIYPNTETKASPKSYCPDNVYGGQYYRTSGHVKYCQSTSQDNGCHGLNATTRYNAGLWYVIHKYTPHADSSNSYGATNGGIIRACLGGGKRCPDSCWWGGCTSQTAYLAFDYNKTHRGNDKCSVDGNHNYGTYTVIKKDGTESAKKAICTTEDQMDADYEANLKKYREAKAQCKAKTVCTTSTAEYTIGFKYSTGEKTVTISVPYNTKDKLVSNPDLQGDTKYTDDYKTSILSYGGCYYNSKHLRWYQTEWTFPGTYTNDKTHQKQYYPPETEKGWMISKGKVCLPKDLLDTNPTWGKKYYQLVFEGKTDSKVTQEKNESTVTSLREGWWCTFKEGSSIANYSGAGTVSGGKSDGYNIKAQAENFGFFKWDFNIYCFYSLLNNPENVNFEQKKTSDSSYSKCIKCTDCEPGKAEVYTYNQSDPLLQGVSDRIQYRGKNNIGYNWKKDYILKGFSIKWGGYDTDPTLLLETIKKDNTFSSPQFKFKLTKTTINKIKAYNKKHTLGEFNIGSGQACTQAPNGVVGYYQSDFLRKEMAGVDGFLLKGSYDQYVGINNTKYPYGITASEVTG